MNKEHGEIAFLIKFVSKKEYADTLMNGELYMRPAMYYHDVEKGRGDNLEGAINNREDRVSTLYKNYNKPIYCMYTVYEKELEENNGEICILDQIISDFECKNGYAVLVCYKPFTKLLEKMRDEGEILQATTINYKITNDKCDILFNLINAGESLLCKRPEFCYQKEFRIIGNNNLKNKEDVKKLKLGANLQEIGVVVPVADILEQEGKNNSLILKERICGRSLKIRLYLGRE